MNDQDVLSMIIEEVYRQYNQSRRHCRSRSRRRELVEPRQWVMYFARKHTRLSLHEIAQVFGRRHATVIYSCRAVENLITHNGYKTRAGQLDEAIIRAMDLTWMERVAQI